MSDDWVVQYNVKFGDHLINLRGDSVSDVMKKLSEASESAHMLHSLVEVLDGRSATEVVQKEKSWGARSQGGRSYPKARSADQIVKEELSGVPMGTDSVSPGGSEMARGEDAPGPCPIHNEERRYFPAGLNKAGNKYSASYRCPKYGCKAALWQQRDGSWA